MKKIIIAHWVPSKQIEEKTGLKHNCEHPYSKDIRNELVDFILENGYNVMIRKLDEALVILIDNGRFTQR